MRKVINYALIASLFLIPTRAGACSPRHVPLRDRDISKSLIVRAEEYQVIVREQSGSLEDVFGAEATLFLKQIKCWAKPPKYGKCPASIEIDFRVYADGANCPHPMEQDVIGPHQGWRYFELSPRAEGGWYISATAKRLKQL